MRDHPAAVVLEPTVQAFVTATAEPPYLFNLGAEAGRKTVNEVQSGKGVVKPDVEDEWVTIAGAGPPRECCQRWGRYFSLRMPLNAA